MKRLLKIGHFLMSIAIMSVAVSCNDDVPEVVDTAKPEMINIQHDEVVEPGGELEITFQLEDNVALGEVRINIHDDFDGHEHERIRMETTPFSYDNILDAMKGQKSYTVQEQIPIPESAATGIYHLQIRFIDAAGNEGELFVSSFVIEGENAPTITITNFGEAEELEVDENGILVLEGKVESRTEGGLDEVHIMVTEEEGHSHGRLEHDGEPLYEREWELNGAVAFLFEEEINPAIDLSEAAPGHYLLTIIAKDVEGNMKTVIREIHID